MFSHTYIVMNVYLQQHLSGMKKTHILTSPVTLIPHSPQHKRWKDKETFKANHP